MLSEILIAVGAVLIVAGFLGLKMKIVGKRLIFLCIAGAGMILLSVAEMNTYGLVGGSFQAVYRIIALIPCLMLFHSICKKNEIKEVSDGYAVNYLIKNGYAVKYTKSSSDRLGDEMVKNKLTEEENTRNAEKIRTKIEKETLVFNVKTGKDGKVFGSISSKQIWTELDKLGYKIDKKKIMIPDALTSIGTFYVYVELYKNVTAKIKVELKK